MLKKNISYLKYLGINMLIYTSVIYIGFIYYWDTYILLIYLLLISVLLMFNKFKIKKDFIISSWVILIILNTLGFITGDEYRNYIHKNTVYSCKLLSFLESEKIEKLFNIFGNRYVLTDQIINCNLNDKDELLIENIIKYQIDDRNGIIKDSGNQFAIRSYTHLKNKYKFTTSISENDIKYLYLNDDSKKHKQNKEIINIINKFQEN